jgi:hypothetical protein
MILYEEPLALSPSHLEMFTLSRVHVRLTEDALDTLRLTFFFKR